MVTSRCVCISVLNVLNRSVRLSVGRAFVTIHMYATWHNIKEASFCQQTQCVHALYDSWISEDIIFPNGINHLVFVVKMQCVCCEVRTDLQARSHSHVKRLLASSCPSVRLSACIGAAPIGRISMNGKNGGFISHNTICFVFLSWRHVSAFRPCSG